MHPRSRENGRAGFGAGRVARAPDLRLSVVSLAVAAMSAIVFALPGTTTPAAAAPTAVTIAEAKAQIEQLEGEAAAIDQEYVGVQEQIDRGRAQLAAKQSDVKNQAAKVAKTKQQVGQVALAQFQNRNVETAAQIFFSSEDSDNFLSQISTLEKVSENQNNVLQDYQEQQARLTELEHSTQTDLAVLTEQQKQLAALRAESDKKIAESKKVLARLTETERAALAAAQKKAEAEVKQQAERAAAGSARSGSSGTARGPGGRDDTTGVTGGRGAKALAFARQELGKPYRLAGTGPGAYDSSGLTRAAWAAAGVRLPRTTEAQFRVGKSVDRAKLQAGDLVFFGRVTTSGQVGLYVGDGVIIHAPRPGRSVEYATVSSMPFSGARRPG